SYGFLFERLRADDSAAFRTNKLKIVNLNYDRSLEHYFRFLGHNRNKQMSKSEVIEYLKAVPIIHPYGQLSELGDDVKMLRPFNADTTWLSVMTATCNFRTMYGRLVLNYLAGARAYLNEADRAIFLGFGFDKFNLKNLQLHGNKASKIATCIGMNADAIAE